VYNLTHGIKPENEEAILKKVNELLNTPNLKKAFQLKKEKMLSEKVDVTKFIIWLIENYPASITKLKADPKYQGTFM
jgi:predicted glycosyltransferase